jgi:hypothetical protein
LGQARLGIAFGLLVLPPLAGCGRGDALERLPVHPVSGSIAFGNKSLEGGLVVFHPVAGSDPRVLPARGVVAADGTFAVTTYESNDGAVVGEYIVTVVRTPLVERDGDQIAGPNVLPEKYSRAESSDLTVHVQAGPNQLSPLTLR